MAVVGQELSFQSQLRPLHLTGMNSSIPRFLSVQTPGLSAELALGHMSRMSWSRLWTLDPLRTRPAAGRRVQVSLCPLQSWGRNPPFPGRSRDTTGHIQGPSPQPLLSQSQSEGTRFPAQTPPPAHKRLPISRAPSLSGLPAPPSLLPPTYPHSCRRHCSVRSGAAETSCR